jgi:hypothetical protein
MGTLHSIKLTDRIGKSTCTWRRCGLYRFAGCRRYWWDMCRCLARCSAPPNRSFLTGFSYKDGFPWGCQEFSWLAPLQIKGSIQKYSGPRQCAKYKSQSRWLSGSQLDAGRGTSFILSFEQLQTAAAWRTSLRFSWFEFQYIRSNTFVEALKAHPVN